MKINDISLKIWRFVPDDENEETHVIRRIFSKILCEYLLDKVRNNNFNFKIHNWIIGKRDSRSCERSKINQSRDRFRDSWPTTGRETNSSFNNLWPRSQGLKVISILVIGYWQDGSQATIRYKGSHEQTVSILIFETNAFLGKEVRRCWFLTAGELF